MRANASLMWILAGFFALSGVVYIGWSMIYYHGTIEWVGAVAIMLSAVMAAFLAFYFGRTTGSFGGVLPEDRLDANIDDGDPELGFFSPWSWWPLFLGFTAALGILGIAVGVWMTFIAAGLFLVGITGWVYEYYRGNFAR